MQIKTIFGCLPTPLTKKFIRRMRFFIFVAFVATLQISATGYSQNATVSVHLKNAGIIDVFNEIERQSEYKIFYKTANIDKQQVVTIDKENITVDALLNTILDKNRVSYEMIDKVIVITPTVVQQGINITGKITDVAGGPIPGVNVTIKGTVTGTVTDVNGKYTINAPNEDAVLLFSFIGYTTQELVVGDQRTIDVALSEDTREIEEVVVVGYGVQKKVNLTGAVEALGSEVFENRSLSNTTQALQGAIPNLNIKFEDGKPNRSSAFNVRGTGSIGQGGNALILIDGVEGDPALLNPNDIASVTVLKDAASAAIYGARGSFGVVLITTKSPQKGKTTVNYTGNYSIQSLAVRPEFVTEGVTWLDQIKLAYQNRNGVLPGNLNGVFTYTEDWHERVRAWNASGAAPKTEILPNGDYEYYANTDWFGLLYKDRSFVQDHNVSVSGGNDKADFYLSGRYYESDGIVNYDPDTYRVYNLRAKGSLMAYPWLKVSNNLEYSRTSYHWPMTANGTGTANVNRYIQVNAPPYMPLYNPDGTYTVSTANTFGGFMDKTNFTDNTTNLFKNTSGFTASFFDNSFRINGDFTFRYNTGDYFFKRLKVPYHRNQNAILTVGTDANSQIRENPSNTLYTASNIYSEFEKTFAKKHYVKVMGGWNYETLTYNSRSMSRTVLMLESAESIQLATGTITNSVSYNRWRTAGVFYRLNYGYDNRYLLEINGRYDGSSRFPTNQQWGFFPSFSGAWRLSEESFWNVNPNIFSDVKFRASWGSLGNGNISPYAYLELFSLGQSPRVLNGVQNQRFSTPSPIPTGLTWEKATTTDIGLDFGMLKGRLRFSSDYYVRKTSDMYTTGPTLPQLYGAAAPKGNYAEMTTRGFEITLTWQDKFMVANKSFSYQVRGTLHDYVSKIDKFYNPDKLYNQHYDGKTFGEIWGLRTDGLFQSDPDPSEYVNNVVSRPNPLGRWVAGEVKFKNLDGSADNAITRGEGTVDNPGDMTIIGNTEPRYQYSFSLSADWNGLFFSAFFQGVGRQHWYPGNQTAFWGQYNAEVNHVPAWHLGNYWTPETPDAYLPRYAFNNQTLGYGGGAVNDRYLQKISYLRLKNLQIGYTLPTEWTSKIRMQSMRIYLSGENLASWSPLYKVAKNFMDVGTVSGYTDSDNSATYDQGSGNNYPLLKTYSLGISLTF